MKKGIMQIIMAIVVIIASVALGIFLAMNYMNNDGADGNKPVSRDSKPMIGLSIDSMVIERWHRDVDIFKTRAEELGFEVEVMNAYEDPDKQVEQLETLIKEGAKALVILPHDKDSLSEVVREAKRQGIVVVAYDRLIENANVDAYVSFDNVAVGEHMARALTEKVPKGNYVIINGSPADNNSQMFNQGFYNILQPYIDIGDINIIEEVWAINWREDIAYNTVDNLMQREIQVDAIIGANDLLAEGAISVLAEYGLAGDIPVVGHDADISACQRIVEGKQLMTVYKPLKNLAEGAAEVVYLLLHQQSINYDATINDGVYQVPYKKFEVIPVDRENMRATIIKDFFHSEEDVYRTNQQE